MKRKSLLLLGVASLMMLASCDNNANTSSSEPETSDQTYETITIAKAIEIANASGETESERYYVAGKIKTITDYTYGDMTLTDGTNDITVFRFRGADGETIYSNLEDKPKVGDDVILYATLCMYKGSPEIKSGYLVKVTHNDSTTDLSGYTQSTIANAREQAKGSKLKVTGVVARITYANGMKKNGFYVIDNTSSIYVYNLELASQVEEGNTVTVAGELDFWILDSEQTSAKKYKYGGACQLTNAILVSNDNGTNDFNKTWITEKTIKEIMNTSYSENVTNKIFKTNALIKKAQGTGYVNYYLDDIDGKTGSYVYTQCNGSDFSWLDTFDGKICTVYVTAMNAKSSAAGCNWRLIPISVSDDNYTFDTTKVGEYVWEYVVKDIFKTKYTGDPMLEVPTSASSELLNFTGATISYASNNTSVAYFSTADDKTTFHAVAEGTATITASVSYSTNEIYSQTLQVEYVDLEKIPTITVKQAIDSTAQAYNPAADDASYVTVRGIAGPSLANQVGFYLIDETGAIAVKTSSEAMGEIELGQEVIMRGLRVNYNSDSAKSVAGQICILDAELIGNLYGKHDYSTASFQSTTFDQLYAAHLSKDGEEDKTWAAHINDSSYTAQVYTLTATVAMTSGSFSSNISLTSGNKKIEIYCSSANQYKSLQTFVGKEVTIEMALCNWNKKTFYKGAVLSATDGETKVYTTWSYDNN